MSRYIAKQVRLTTMEECKQPGCGCFTQAGYYIQYQNSNVDSVLFVCDSCYDEKFKSKCSLGHFDEERYFVRANNQRYWPVNPLLRNLIRWSRNTTRTMRIASVAVAMILVTAFGLKEHPVVRNEFTAPKVHANINTNIHFAFHDLEQLNVRSEVIANQLTNVYTHGGKIND